ncbi:MAG: hypothetical protein WBV76_04615, partial [Pseudolabrys sp.]
MNASRRDVRFTPESGHTLGQLRQCVRVMRESVAVCSLAQRPPSSGLSPFPLFLLTVTVIAVVSLLVHFLPTQEPTS